jgi:adenylosuccinate lyase
MSCSTIDPHTFRNLYGAQEIRKIFNDESYVQCMIDAEAGLAWAGSKTGM